MNAHASLLSLQAELMKQCRATGRPLGQLMTWVLDRRNLDALDRVCGTDGANTPGIDGVTANEIEGRAEPWLAQLADNLFHEHYRPSPPRWVEIPKGSGGGTRTLGILTLRDRVVHAAVKQVLEPILDPVFHAGSFGFRPGRCVAGALATAIGVFSCDDSGTLPFDSAVRLDVADCFATIDHELLLQQLQLHVADSTLLGLIGRMLAAGGTRVGHWWWQHECGIVQGSSLSPLLCNLYLHPLDEALAELGRATQNGVQSFRYADDLLVLARDARIARQAVSCVQQTLRRLRQTLKDAKTCVCPVREGVEWLGVRIQPHLNRWTGKMEFGYVIPDPKVLNMLDRVTEITTPPSMRIDARAFDLGRWIVSVNEQLREWREAYVYADNAQEVFRTIDEAAQERVAELLHSVTGKRRGELHASFRVRLPRGFSTWQIQGTRLVVLSSLAPRLPYRLTRRPAFQCFRPPVRNARPSRANLGPKPIVQARLAASKPEALARQLVQALQPAGQSGPSPRQLEGDGTGVSSPRALAGEGSAVRASNGKQPRRLRFEPATSAAPASSPQLPTEIASDAE